MTITEHVFNRKCLDCHREILCDKCRYLLIGEKQIKARGLSIEEEYSLWEFDKQLFGDENEG